MNSRDKIESMFVLLSCFLQNLHYIFSSLLLINRKLMLINRILRYTSICNIIYLTRATTTFVPLPTSTQEQLMRALLFVLRAHTRVFLFRTPTREPL